MNPKPSKMCKAVGLSSLEEMARLSTVSIFTLIHWHKNKFSQFECMLYGAVALKFINNKKQTEIK